MKFGLKNPHVVKDYANVFSYATGFNQAWLRKGKGSFGSVVTAARSVRGIDEDRPRGFIDTFIGSKESKELVRLSSQSLDIAKPVIFDISPSSNLTVSLHTFFLNSSNVKEEKPYIEVQGGDIESYRIDVSSIHGAFIGDTWFGGCSWSSDEKFFTFVAKVKEEKKVSYFSTPTASTTNNGSCNGNDYGNEVASNKYNYTEDWGEKYDGVSILGIFVLDIINRRVISIPDIDVDEWTVGQPCLITQNISNTSTAANTSTACATSTATKYSLAYTAWRTKPRKLGMIYCYQRPCSIFHVDITSLVVPCTNATSDKNNSVTLSHRMLTASLKLARSPRASVDGRYLVFLGNTKGYNSHGGCSELFRIDLSTLDASKANVDVKVRTIVAAVYNPLPTAVAVATTSAQEGKVVCEWLRPFDTAAAAGSNPYGNSDIIPDGTATSFPGLFCDQLPKQCFLSDNTTIVLNSTWNSSDCVLIITPAADSSGNASRDGSIPMTTTTTTSTRIQRVELSLNVTTTERKTLNHASSAVLDVQGDSFVYVISAPNSPPKLGVYNIATQKVECEMKKSIQHGVKIIDGSVPVTTAEATTTSVALKALPKNLSLENACDWTILRHVTDDIPFESIVVYPTGSSADGSGTGGGDTNNTTTKGLPLIVVPHGGPHSVFITSFVAAYTFLALHLNAVVLMVNYRGSTGYGQASIDSLLGHVGTNDVADLMHAIDALNKVANGVHDSTIPHGSSAVPRVDMDRISIVGGSHGGFLAAHMIGQHPDVFKVAAMRNPVTDIAAECAVSDIPDWCIVECHAIGETSYDFTRCNIPTEQQLLRMRQCSPVIHVDKMIAPTLICLGMKDRRVPHSQGVELYHLLRDRGVTTRLMTFPEDVHAIDKPASEAEHWVAIADWIDTHL